MPPIDKIKTIEELAELVRAQQADSKTVVQCHGVFDLLHIGHIRYFQKARQLGDVLVVTLTPDEFVNRGPHRPAFEQRFRADAIAALEGVDYVAVNKWPTATEAIELLRPDVYVKGAEFRRKKTPELRREEAALSTVGSRIEFIEDVTSSSSRLINQYLSPFPQAVEQYLRRLALTYPNDEILNHLRRAGALRVLVVGEAIIDEYYLCSVLGRSAKAPIIAAQYQSHERFAGGSLAVANHLAAFCGEVGLVAMLGAEDSEEQWVRGQLDERIDARFFKKSRSPTIVKRRYRESYFGAPLFEINFLDDSPLEEDDNQTLSEILQENVADYDCVVVADCGHAMLGKDALRILADASRFLAVNTQANAANVGFHTIANYPRADYISLAEQALRLECRSRGGDLQRILEETARRLGATTAAVTVGKSGSICYNQASGCQTAPALAVKVVDRFGAAEAFFSITSVCAALGVPVEILAFLGNVAAAEAVSVVGNSRFLEELAFSRHVQSLLK